VEPRASESPGFHGSSARAGESIPERLRGHVERLASDELAGREVGTPGIREAEEYVARAFRDYGLEPVPGREDYYLGFTLYRVGFDSGATELTVSLPWGAGRGRRGRRGLGGRTPIRAEAGRDFRPFHFSAPGEAASEVVFAGYGITAPEYDYDDYEGLEVQGKIVLVLRHEPNENDPQSRFDGTSLTDHALFTEKAGNALRRGAAGMLLVTDPLHHPPEEDLRLTSAYRLQAPGAGPEGRRRPAGAGILPAAQISMGLARSMASAWGRSLEELQRAVDGGQKPAELELTGVRARLRVELLQEPVPVAARNVAGFLPGSDPLRAGEWVLIGAHHDHLGAFAGSGDTIYNGADDNASGVAGVLELARRFASLEDRPARSLVFVTFSAEEKGLLGSRALVSQRLLPTGKLVFMLNLDMIGRNPGQAVQVYGDATARALGPIVREAAGKLGLEVALHGTRIMSASDHTPFYEAGIPVLALFTGLHQDYHRPSDEAGTLAYERMESILGLAAETVRSVAELEEAPAFSR